MFTHETQHSKIDENAPLEATCVSCSGWSIHGLGGEVCIGTNWGFRCYMKAARVTRERKVHNARKDYEGTGRCPSKASAHHVDIYSLLCHLWDA
jgi:hypothetical protein